MIKLIDLNYHTHSNISNPEEVLELQKASIGFADFIKEKLSIQLIKHLNYESEKYINDVKYVFFKSKNKFLHIPFKTHGYIRKQNLDIILIQGLTFPLQSIALKLILPKETKIIVQHHGERPFTGIKKSFQKIADHFIDVYLFTSIENANEWIDKKIIRDKKKCSELLEASTFFTVKDKLECRRQLSFKGNQNFLWVGRLNKGKDPITVINAFENYIVFHPEARLFMIFHTEELLQVIKGKLEENEHLKKAVLLKGKVNHGELETWYNAADFFISASHKEGSGYAMIEAMSCGCIPIVTEIPSFKKITDDGKFGFLFEPGNPEGLFNILLNSKNIERETLTKSIVNHFNNSLSFRSIADKLFSICERLTEK
jgi:glycosyltransferase involved in cell wall biosynthesis